MPMLCSPTGCAAQVIHPAVNAWTPELGRERRTGGVPPLPPTEVAHTLRSRVHKMARFTPRKVQKGSHMTFSLSAAPSRSFLLFVCLATSLPVSAAAQWDEHDNPQTARLDFSSDGNGCPEAGTFADEVSARIGRVAFAAESDEVVHVRLMRTGDEALATAEFGGNSRVFRDADCRVAAEAAAAAIAVWLDEPSLGPAASAPVGAAAVPGGYAEASPRGNAEATPDQDEDEVVLHVTAVQPGLVLHRQTGEAHAMVYGGNGGSAVVHAQYHEAVCVAPCEARVERGTHQLAVSQGSGPPINIEGSTQLESNAALHLDYEDNSAYRWGAWAALGVGLVGGGVLMMAPFFDYDSEQTDFLPWLIAGGTTMVVGLITALILGRSDAASITF